MDVVRDLNLSAASQGFKMFSGTLIIRFCGEFHLGTVAPQCLGAVERPVGSRQDIMGRGVLLRED